MILCGPLWSYFEGKLQSFAGHPQKKGYMQSVSKRFGRVAAVLVVSSLLLAESAFASARQEDRGGWFFRLRRGVVKILSEIGFPPG